MLASSINFKSEGKPGDIALARYATYFKAFARLYLNPEYMWTSELLDELLREGLALYTQSEKEGNALESPLEIYSESEQRIQREFQMSGCGFHVELMRKFRMGDDNGAKGDHEDVGGDEGELPFRDLKNSLRKFFKSYKYGLLTFGNVIYVLLWRSQGAYMILDVCGRRMDFQSDREKGMAMLVCVQNLENVRHLLVGLTNLPKIDSFSLREMKMVKVQMPSGEVVQRDYGLRLQQWECVNEDYAYLKASLHLSLNPKDLLRNRSALPAGVMAIVVSKLDHPATWNMKILDKIMCYGVRFCQQAYWASCPMQGGGGAINVLDFPHLFDMAQYRVRIDLLASKYDGFWRCVPGYRYSEMADHIGKAFVDGDNQLLLQINYQFYAIWRKNDFIYLFDPFRHRILGQPDTSAAGSYEEMEKSGTLRMFGCMEVFLNTLQHILLDSNRSSPFRIHSLRILKIAKRDQKEEEEDLNSNVEVQSLNEHVCFEESDDFCHNLLAEISDYEDEDLLSDVDELELRTSSSEGELGLEEEEAGGGGEEEEMEGLESSSSGEEDNKKGKGGGAGSGKGGKAKITKKSKKSAGKGDKKSGGGQKAKERKKAGESMEDEENKNQENEALGKEKNPSKPPGDESKLKTEKSKMEDKNASKEANKKDTHKESEEGDKPSKGTTNLEETGDKKKSENEEKKKIPAEGQGLEKPPTTPISKPPEVVKHDKQVEAKLMPSETPAALAGDTLEVPKTSSKKSHYPKSSACGHEADNEHETESLFDIKRFCTTTIPNPNRYPGYFKCPLDMAVVGSENGSYESLSKLLLAGFSRADRLLAMTPWGNFVVFRCFTNGGEKDERGQERPHAYYLFDGCTCNVNRFRHLDLSLGTAGLLCFQQLHDVIEYMRRIRQIRQKEKRCKRKAVAPTADEICQEYCG
ncbi:uncharacterized protein LOC133323392 [Musca vetustissima]|uniref:uncharacterized protein LOC133323392 n=1 Tax=Musca vetustissima TaxID=27455 RepID=UPI002AB646DC|nr:uncharacterized protein LOC133323392 [Musca vetustissima]